MTLDPPHPPAVLPRLLLAFGAGAAALLAHWWIATAVLASGLAVIALRADGTVRRTLGGAVALFVVATLVFTPAWLHLLAGVPLRLAVTVGATRALRLGAVLAVGLALGVALPPLSWLVALRRFPRLALVLTLTFRQVPDLADEAGRIRRAQRARGLAGGPLATRPLAVATPLVVRSLQRAERLGDTLVLSGWTTGDMPRDPAVRARFGPTDAVLAFLGVVLALLALARFFNWT